MAVHPSKRSGRGFTLIEAMVALVIIGGAGMALFSWVNASIVALRRVEDANARSEATANAIEYMQSVNPMLQPEGRAQFGAYRIAWHAKRQAGVADGIGYPRGLSLFQLALYDTQVVTEHGDGAFWFELKLTLVGYKKVRQQVAPL